MPLKPSRVVSGRSGRLSRRGDVTLEELRFWGETQLNAKLGKIEARASVERLLEELAGCDRMRVYLDGTRRLPASARKRFESWIGARRKRIPLDYILGATHFWNEVLEVGPDCLIPRPSTEVLVERFISDSGFGKEDRFSFLDLGCGSGAIGLALLREFPRARAVFADISRGALKVTRRNLARYGLLGRAETLKSDLFSGLKGRRFAAVVSNPPYLSARDLRIAQPEVLKEPIIALSGGQDGLEMYRNIIRRVPEYLEPGGLLVLEMGRGQAKKIAGFCSGKFTKIRIFKDYAGIDRILMARLHG